jgi:hypothetical protein
VVLVVERVGCVEDHLRLMLYLIPLKNLGCLLQDFRPHEWVNDVDMRWPSSIGFVVKASEIIH